MRVLLRAHPRDRIMCAARASDTIPHGTALPATKLIGSISTNPAETPRSSRRPCARPKPLWFSHFVILLQSTQSFCDLVNNFLYIELNHFYYSAQPFFDCYSAQPFCDFVILNSPILWFCYNYLSHFVILLVILYTLNSAIFPTMLSHFLIATVLRYFVILLY
jgi:hypothetical protein